MNRVQLSTISIHNSNFNTHSSLFLRFLSYFRFSKKMSDLFVLIQLLTMFNLKYVFRLNLFVSCSFVFCTTYISNWNVCFCFILHKNSINCFLITHTLRFEFVIIENWNIYSHFIFWVKLYHWVTRVFWTIIFFFWIITKLVICKYKHMFHYIKIAYNFQWLFRTFFDFSLSIKTIALFE